MKVYYPPVFGLSCTVGLIFYLSSAFFPTDPCSSVSFLPQRETMQEGASLLWLVFDVSLVCCTFFSAPVALLSLILSE